MISSTVACLIGKLREQGAQTRGPLLANPAALSDCGRTPMRLWSIHPKFLDSKGLVALWREGLLAQKILAGKAKGYRRHPQLIRFQKTKDPLTTIGAYLSEIVIEAKKRNFHFDEEKILVLCQRRKLISVSREQISYESKHLLGKLKLRAPDHFSKHSNRRNFSVHPIFKPVPGRIEDWERVLS